ncbi:hypothetical protein SEUCBS139899_001451 [Sporothrix eucalyptigena]|uniref:Uncharacterized protein n=1 Tax=Sporothrix eucalyptigena TaxID=1812306 RepID=A0ABP0CE83_9PEZI
MTSKAYAYSPYSGLDRQATLRLVNDILYKPSAEEVAALERQEAAAKAAKAARKAEKAMRSGKYSKYASTSHSSNSYSSPSYGSASYSGASSTTTGAYTYRPSMDDRASVFSTKSTSSYGSFRNLLSRKNYDKATQ